MNPCSVAEDTNAPNGRSPLLPTQHMRTIATLEHYMATVDAHGLQIHLFHTANISTTLESGIRSTFTWSRITLDGKRRW